MKNCVPSNKSYAHGYCDWLFAVAFAEKEEAIEGNWLWFAYRLDGDSADISRAIDDWWDDDNGGDDEVVEVVENGDGD